MMAAQIDGKTIAAELRTATARAASRLQAERNLVPGLAIVVVGEDPASSVYVKAKTKQAEVVGLRSQQFSLSSNTSEFELLNLIGKLNGDDAVDGILVQLPLPGHITVRAYWTP